MPKLTLRDLFAVVTIVALSLGWAVDHWRLVQRERRTREVVRDFALEVARHGYVVEFGHDGRVSMTREQP